MSLDLSDSVAVIRGEPDYLDRLAYCLADAAESLRSTQRRQGDAQNHTGVPDLFSEGAPT